MAATAAQIARLRRMIAEPEETTYLDDDLASYIEAVPVFDADGNEPSDEGWTATYDLNGVASQLWEEKAAAAAADFDFSADGGNYSRSQVAANCMKMARRFASKRTIATIEAIVWPPPNQALDTVWIGNQAEDDI